MVEQIPVKNEVVGSSPTGGAATLASKFRFSYTPTDIMFNMELPGDTFPQRVIERHGGLKDVGSTLWLEHVDGIQYEAEDGSIQMLRPQDLVEDEAKSHGSPSFDLKRAMSEDASMLPKEYLLRNFVLRMLPIKITGDSSKAPIIFDSEFSVFTVPQELTKSPGSISEISTIFDGTTGESRDLSKEKAITFALRLIPNQGYVKDFAFYPGTTDSSYALAALEINPEIIRLQYANRVYLEICREKPTETLPPLIAPHQF